MLFDSLFVFLNHSIYEILSKSKHVSITHNQEFFQTIKTYKEHHYGNSWINVLIYQKITHILSILMAFFVYR